MSENGASPGSDGLDNHVEFVVTGFGPFRGVKCNPTTKVAERIAAFVPKNSTVRIRESVVIETSAAATKDAIDNIRNRLYMSGISYGKVQSGEKLGNLRGSGKNGSAASDFASRVMFQDEDTPNANNNDSRSGSNHIVLLHLGVNYAGKQIQVEECAYNDATFRVPDERGYQPRSKKILEDVPLGARFSSILNVPRIADEFNKGKSDGMAPIAVSNDPGRFVCNYTYFYSMSREPSIDSKAVYVLFLHVPPESIIPIDNQLEAIYEIMQKIAQQIKLR